MRKRAVRLTGLWLLVSGVLALGGCASLALQPAGPYASLTPRDAVNTQNVGARVRWGGQIIDTQPKANRTCFVVLGQPLYYDGEPQGGRTESLGRFVACSPGFYDPALYAQGRQITVAGDITGFETRKVGGYSVSMPVLDAGAPHLWPAEPRVRYVTVPGCEPFCSPFFWPPVYYYYYPVPHRR